MKNAIIPLFTIVLLLSASFGLVMMNHMDEDNHVQCPFEAAGIMNCTQVQSPINFITSHANVLSKFFSAIPVDAMAGLVALSLLLIFTIFTLFNKDFGRFKLKRVYFQNRLYESFVSPNKILFTSWFSLHENSPAFMMGR